MTETVKHTPGPWKAEHASGPTNQYAAASTGVWSQQKFDAALDAGDEDNDPMDAAWICGIWGNLSPEDFANARLIAAAPDLFQALEELLEAYSKPDERLCCDGRDCGCMGSTVHQQAEHYARAAIARAEGRS